MYIRNLITAVAISMALPALACETADTVMVIPQPGTVTVVENNGGIQVNVLNTDNETNYQYAVDIADVDGNFPRKSTGGIDMPFFDTSNGVFTTSILNGIHFGALIPTDAPEGVDTYLEGGIDEVIGWRYKPFAKGPALNFGAGFNVKNLTLADGKRFHKPDRDRIEITDLMEGLGVRRCHLNMFSITIPARLTYNFSSKVGISAGCVMNLNTYCTAVDGYKFENRTYTAKLKGLNQRFFSVDIVGALYVGDVGLMVRYAPQSWFTEEYGPQFKTLSIALAIGF